MSKFQGPSVRPGDRFIFRDVDGTEEEGTVHTINYRSGLPEIHEQPTGWRRVLRNLTPQRWRKPLPIVRHAELPTIEVMWRHEHALRAIDARLDSLLKSDVAE